MNKPTFPCLAWNVPIGDFDKWIARGVNVLVGCGLTAADTPQARLDWAAAAKTKGLWTIYDPQGLAVLENFYAAMMPDEMDGKEWPVGSGHWNGWPPEKIKPYYDAFKARGFTVLMSCQGNKVTDPNRLAYYQSIAPYSDIWMEDGYPRNKNAITYNESLWPGKSVNVLKQAAPNKPCWAMLESGYQKLKNSPNGRGPTAAEVTSAFDLALGNGANGIGIFSHHFNGNDSWVGWDNTPADVAAIITDRFRKLNPVTPPAPTLDQRVTSLESWAKSIGYK